MAERCNVMGKKWTNFYEIPGILLIRLMSRCNEKCVFCMVETEISETDDVEYSEAEAMIVKQPPGTIIEFFGGEPTIYPHFMRLLQLARGRGYHCSIATNARIFHSSKFTRRVSELGVDNIYIRTSLY